MHVSRNSERSADLSNLEKKVIKNVKHWTKEKAIKRLLASDNRPFFYYIYLLFTIFYYLLFIIQIYSWATRSWKIYTEKSRVISHLMKPL